MGFLLYVFIGFVVFFFSYKIWMVKGIAWADENYHRDLIQSKYFWVCVLTSVFWIIAVPMHLMWWALEKLFGKFFNSNN